MSDKRKLIKEVEDAMLWKPADCFLCKGTGWFRPTYSRGEPQRCEKCDGFGTLYRQRGSRSRRWYNERERKQRLLNG